MKKILVIVLVLACVMTQSGIVALASTDEGTTVSRWVMHEKKYDVIFEVESEWEGHFNGKMTLKNTGNKTIHNWNLCFCANFKIENLWNAKLISEESGNYFINNAEWNQDIDAGQERTFGFTAAVDDEISRPSQFKMINYLTDVRDDAYEVDYKCNSDWGDGFTGEIIIRNTSDATLEDWELYFDMNRDIQFFWSAEQIKKEGSRYHIINQGFNANIKAGECLSIGIMGRGGKKEDEPEKFRLRQVSYKDFASADTDNDGLTNELELQIGSDYEEPDTDKDGLSDGYEYGELETNPCKRDTDGNGVSDAEEDFDNDGLTNLEEYKAGTDAFEEDTDEDGLSDYEELIKYQTDPLQEDTDDDGLRDGDDVDLGFSPRKKDTDDNGILDPDESKYQTLTTEIHDDEKEEVTKVSMSLKTTDHIKNVVEIDNIYNVDMLSSEVEGLVGVPVEITSSHGFDTAEIVFHYDESRLNGVKEEDLAVLWYDEENDWFEILDDSTVDQVNNTVSVRTTHFSKYMLVDSAKWFETWSQELDYRGKYAYYDIAYAIDTSKSMKTDNRLKTAKKAMISFIKAQQSKDKGTLISFGGSANVVKKLGTAKNTMAAAVNDLAISTSNGTDIEGGLEKSIEQLGNGKNNSKIIILVSDGSVSYKEEIVKAAKEKSIHIFTVNVGNTSAASNMKKYSEQTGGEYYYCPTVNKIETALVKIQGISLDKVDETDHDADGVYDIYEKMGFRASNGKLIKTNPNKKDTDGEGLTDGEEIGLAYKGNGPLVLNSVLKKVGKGKTIKVRYFKLYSNPTKKDTDGDGITDDKDSYPWNGYCGGKHPEVAFYHKYELQESGYYKCKKCGYQIKSPEMQDKDILTKEDKQEMACLAFAFTYYALGKIEKSKNKDSLSRNEKLLLNKMRKIRRKKKYTGKYSYSNLEGKCMSEKYPVKGTVIIRRDKVTLANKGWYNGVYFDLAGKLLSACCPLYGAMWTVISYGSQWENYDTLEAAETGIINVSSMSLEYVQYKVKNAGYKEIYKMTRKISLLFDIYNVYSLIDSTFWSNAIKVGDDIISICIQRDIANPLKESEIKQSHSTFIMHELNQPYYVDLGTEYGHDNWWE